MYELTTMDKIKARARMFLRNPMLIGLIVGPIALLMNSPFTGAILWLTAALQIIARFALNSRV